MRSGKNIYYVDKNKDTFCQLEWITISDQMFDFLYKPTTEPRVLLTDELQKITEYLQHGRIEHTNWHCTLFYKQYSQAI